MGANISDGGAAFPREDYQADAAPGQRGMTLRDYFAAKAMQAALTNESLLKRIGQRAGNDIVEGHSDIASGAYAMADAMIAEREK